MPKAEIGSTKYLNNKLKSKGLQRLRWYCQVCEKQCRDENGFKMHTQSESHVRQMLVVGADAKKYINDYSSQYQRDFLQLLRTSHGEKKVHLNHFYQEYISNKEHVHLNATKWPSLTEFAKMLGREGICRVEEDEKGLHISWVDNSPENLRRQDALRKKERQDRGDEEREQALIREQVERAKMDAEERGEADLDDEERQLKRAEGEKIKLSFGAKPVVTKSETSTLAADTPDDNASLAPEPGKTAEETENKGESSDIPVAPAKVSLKMGFSSKPKNIFAAAKKNALGGQKTKAIEQPKKMSEAERIMREEMERQKKRGPSAFGGPAPKKVKYDTVTR
jgi:DNA/RNA-binding protein KIN17